MQFNLFFFNLIHGLSGRNFVADDLGIFFANWLPYIMVLGFLVLVFHQSGWRRKFFVFIFGALAAILSRGIIDEVIKFFYHHPRPFDALNFTPLISESGWSFPSGHASLFFALSLAVLYFNRKWGIWYLILSSANGIARIYVGVHWPLDILGGVVVGLLSAWLIRILLKPVFSEFFGAKTPPPPGEIA